jgi:hypothetical protein
MNVINHDLFPTRISVYEPDHKITDDERDFIKGIKTRSGHVNDTVQLSQRQDIIHEPELREIKRVMMNVAEHYKEEVLGINNEIFGCANWVAKQARGNHHHRHDHPNSLFGLVYYIEGSHNAKLMVELNQSKSILQQGFNLSYDIKKNTIMNTSAVTFTPEDGKIVCLPSWVYHGTTISQGDRWVVAWNFFLKGVMGEPPYDRY